MQKGGPALRPALQSSSDLPVDYGVNLLIRVDQFASAVRGPGARAQAPAHVPSRLSPVPPTKNGATPCRVVARAQRCTRWRSRSSSRRRPLRRSRPSACGRVGAILLLVAGEAVVRRGTRAARDVVPGADSGVRVDRRIGGTRIRRVTRIRESHDSAAARRDADRRIREVVSRRAEVALERRPCRRSG